METIRKNSKKRNAILEAMRSTKSHPDAEWLYSKLKPDYPDLSLATVYRNLALFMESGDVVRVCTVSGRDRFDANVEPHGHFVCSRCGRVEDVECEVPQDSVRTLGPPGALVTGATLSLSGLCADCRERA